MIYLNKAVTFQQYGDMIYLRNIDSRQDYLFNEITGDILEYIRSSGSCSIESLMEHLQSIYDVPEESSFYSDIQGFVYELMEESILYTEEVQIPQKISNDTVRDKVRQYCLEHHLVMSACLELTYRCTEHCIHCYADDETNTRQELKLEDYQKILDELKEMGCISILLTGGEPTLHPDFLEIAKYAKEKGFLVDIFTNGLVADSLLKQMIELKPNSISFSFYGGTAAVHDNVTGIKGSFEKSLRTMMFCKCAGVDTYIKSVVMKQNISDFEELLKLGKLLQIDITTSLTISPTHCGKSAEPFRLLSVEQYLSTIELQKQYHYLPESVEEERADYFCNAGRNQLSIDPYGGVYPCNGMQLLLGNVNEKSLKKIWNNSEELQKLLGLQFDQLSPKCSDCSQRNWCTICIGSAIKEHGKLAPCSDTCMLAQANALAYQKG